MTEFMCVIISRYLFIVYNKKYFFNVIFKPLYLEPEGSKL